MYRVVRSRYRILYGDTDAMGIAYYANYLKWFEMGRNEWLRQMGVTYAEIEAKDGTFAPVTKAFCHYLRPARYDDLIVVETDVEYVRKASIKFVYRIIRDDNGEELVQGYTIHAFVDREGRIVRTPKRIIQLMERLKVEEGGH
jgi:acyl-CoA thioester hydrolase